MQKRKRRRRRDPIFARRRFADEVILLCVRWYLRFKLSYRDLSRIMYELGIAVAPCTILHWVVYELGIAVAPCPILHWLVRYSIELSHRCQRYQKPVGRSWRADETYVRVSGRWMYLYRAVDELGHTVASHLSRTRDMRAAKTFFRKALKQHGQPRTIPLDGFEPSHSAWLCCKFPHWTTGSEGCRAAEVRQFAVRVLR